MHTYIHIYNKKRIKVQTLILSDSKDLFKLIAFDSALIINLYYNKIKH